MDGFIPYDVRSEYIWINGKLLKNADVKIHPQTHGLQYGGVTFDGIRHYNHLFMLTQHNERMIEGAKEHHMEVPFTVEELNEACIALYKANNVEKCYLRPFVYLGSEDILVAGTRSSVQVVIASFPLEDVGEQEIKLKIASMKRAPGDVMKVETKSSTIFTASRLGKLEATDAGYDDALFLDTEGNLADGSVWNVIVVMRDGTVVTPEAGSILVGITLRVLIAIMKRTFNITVVKRKIALSELKNAVEMFGCGTAFEVKPFVQIENQVLEVGPIYKKVRAEYFKLVNMTESQVDKYLGIVGGTGLPA